MPLTKQLFPAVMMAMHARKAIVNMPMRMRDHMGMHRAIVHVYHYMAMFMRMTMRERIHHHKDGACGHDDKRDEKRWRKGLAQQGKRKQRAHKGGNGIIRARLGGP